MTEGQDEKYMDNFVCWGFINASAFFMCEIKANQLSGLLKWLLERQGNTESAQGFMKLCIVMS